MIQELIALAVIFFFLVRLGWQLYKDQISKAQFLFWTGFWFFAGLLIIFIHQIDNLIARFGFSIPGIQFLVYLAVPVLFYWIFTLRLKVERMSQDITKLTRAVALSSARATEDK